MASNTALLLQDFFPAAAVPPSLSSALAAAPPLAPCHRHFLLAGPDRSGKTTLLMHLAYSLASKGASVLFIASKERLESGPPAIAKNLFPSDPIWKQIGMKYLEDGTAALRYASLLHMSPNPPNVILIDDLDKLIRTSSSNTTPSLIHDLTESHHEWGSPSGATGSGSGASGGSRHAPRSRDAALCRLLAVFTDSLDHVNRITGRVTLLGASVSRSNTGEAPLVFPLLKRWLPCALGCRPVTIAPGMGGGINDNRDLLRLSALDDDGVGAVGWAADFSLNQGTHLTLEGLAAPSMTQIKF